MRGLVWFREDLRTIDNTALHYAATACKEGIAAVYILDKKLWKKCDTAPCHIEFILRGLKILRSELQKLNIPLFFLETNKTEDTPEVLLTLINKIHAEGLFFNYQYEIYEKNRDEAITKYLTTHGIQVQGFHDQTILAPGTVKTQQNNYFSVFAPYKRQWYKIFNERKIKLLPKLKSQPTFNFAIEQNLIPTTLSDFKSTINAKLWPAGQHNAIKKLNYFIDNNLFNYDSTRNYPALDTTSKLSPYLATGMISPRQCFLAAYHTNQNELDSGNKGAVIWMSELIWRDFYKDILISVPRVSKNKAYKEPTDNIKWDYDEKLFLAWQQGQTGYPIIDAAMRQLNTTGWMHNRLRMIVAMFLTKNLFFDWRLGEKYFMSHLIDGDLSANNGGWQWSASTGTDAAPYFRIMNPLLQSKRFDPNGNFIKKYCPELSGIDKKFLHEANLNSKHQYPQPIIELKQNRSKVMEAFKKNK